MIKKLTIFLLSTLLVLSVSLSANASYYNNLQAEAFVSKELFPYSETRQERTTTQEEESPIKITIHKNLQTLQLVFMLDDKTVTTLCSGTVTSVVCDQISGYVGVYESIVDDYFITVDAVFTDSDVFAMLTIQEQDAAIHSVRVYGDFCDSLKEISTKNSCSHTAIENAQLFSSSPSRSVDASLRYKGKTNIKCGSNTVGQLSVFHANELRNQSATPLRIKVNTDSEALIDYLLNDMEFEYEIIGAYADHFYITSEAASPEITISAAGNAYGPKPDSESFTLKLPVYNASTGSVATIDLSFTTSSVTVNGESDDSQAAFYGTNDIGWDIYQMYGWNATKTDGTYSDRTGMPVYVEYRADFTIDESVADFSESLYFTGAIRYEYVYELGDAPVTGHIRTNTARKTSSITILND